jgi:hypothetical protein
MSIGARMIEVPAELSTAERAMGVAESVGLARH